MKKIIRLELVILAILLLIPTIAMAKDDFTNYNIEYQCMETINNIENILRSEETTILNELIKIREEYSKIILSEDDEIKMKELDLKIEVLDEEINLFERLNNIGLIEGESNVFYNTQYLDRVTSISPNAIAIKGAIASMKAYFSIRGFALSKELLEYSQINTSPTRLYVPDNKMVLRVSDIVSELKKQPSGSGGTSRFPYGPAMMTADAHFAINKFRWRRGIGTKLHIYDRYDFESDPNSSYNDIVNHGVSIMVEAERLGIITYFDVQCSF